VECIETIEKLNAEAILRLVEYIKVAKKIHILARGVTRLTAQEFEFQLQCQKYSAYAQWDSQVMCRFDELVEEEELVIILSLSNTTPELKIAAELAKKKGAIVVVCCCVEGSDLEKIADITIIGKSVPIVAKKALGCASRIPLQIIGRTVIEYLAMD
jgi:DNA-binding MurR/RpiR family transcriptional regulator